MSVLGKIMQKVESRAVDQPADLGEYILEFSSATDAQREYAVKHLGRLARTLQLTPPGERSSCVLEMGAYMQLTPALKRVLGYGEVRGCYLGPLGRTDRKSVKSLDGKSFSCEIDLFNAEKDRYPYPDERFDTVICCELFEHLSDDPMHLMTEVNRILKPGGHLVMSTPSIISLRSVAAVLKGGHPGLYSQFMKPREDPEPRHAREYAPWEIPMLFQASGLEVEVLETGPYGRDEPPGLEWVVDLLKQHELSTELRGETIHAVGRKTGPVIERYPGWLYD